MQLTMAGVVEAFSATHAGYSADRVVADPELNAPFTEACRDMGLVGEPRTWNMLLFRLRKSGGLTGITTKRTTLDWAECDAFLFASEIAWRMLLDEERAGSLDEILCDPDVSQEFDRIANRFAPGFTPLSYRWAALKLRKQSKLARIRADSLSPPTRIGKAVQLGDFDPQRAPEAPGVYVLGVLDEPRSRKLYVGEALNLSRRLARQFHHDRRDLWRHHADRCGLAPEKLSLWLRPLDAAMTGMLAWQTCLVRRYRPYLNLAISQ
jgi:site-specific DNA-methyltransferase (adenine-specific)